MTTPDPRRKDDAPAAAQAATTGRIHLHIDRLELRGIDGGQVGPLIERLSAGLRSRWSEPAAVDELVAGTTRSRRSVRGRTAPGAGDVTELGEAFAEALVREIAR